MSTKEIIAKNITYLRKGKKLTQSELADKLHYSNKAISKWERGDSLPDAEMLKEIAVFFGVPIEYLFEEHDFKDVDEKILDAAIKKREIWIKIIFILIIFITVIIILEVSLLSVRSIYDSVEKYAGLLFIIPFIPLTIFIINLITGRLKYSRTLLLLFFWSLSASFYFFFKSYEPVFVFWIAFLFSLLTVIFPYLGDYVKRISEKKQKNKWFGLGMDMNFLIDSINPKPLWLWVLVTFLGGAIVITTTFVLLSKKYKNKK